MSEDIAEVAGRVMPAIKAVEQRCGDAVTAIIAAHPQACGPIACTEQEWNGQQDAFEAREAFYAAMMPDEQDAIRVMHAAYERLKALGWREAIYCPKDGSSFDAIEPGSTGIHSTHYEGEGPNGGWWTHEAGDLWPSRPCLYRPTEAEIAERERRAASFRDHLETTR